MDIQERLERLRRDIIGLSDEARLVDAEFRLIQSTIRKSIGDLRGAWRGMRERGSVTLIFVFFCALLVGGLLIYSFADAAEAIGDVYTNTGSPSDAVMTYFRYAWKYLPAVIFFGLLSFLLVQLQKSKYTPGGV